MKKTSTIIKDINKMFGSKIALASVTPDGVFYIHVSAESGDDVADYWGEFRGGYPWINPLLEEYAEKNDLDIDWIDCGSLCLFFN